MTKLVLDDLKEFNDRYFHFDDIVKIYALRFYGVNSRRKFLKALSNLENQILNREEVGLYNKRLIGTHAYLIKLLGDKEVNVPIW